MKNASRHRLDMKTYPSKKEFAFAVAAWVLPGAARAIERLEDREAAILRKLDDATEQTDEVSNRAAAFLAAHQSASDTSMANMAKESSHEKV